MTTRSKKIKDTKKTYSEFISWLEGVESMQEKGWTPNTDQWKLIRKMLFNIIPDIEEIEPTNTKRLMNNTGNVANIIEPTIRPQSNVPPVKQFPSGVQSILDPTPTVEANTEVEGEMHKDSQFV